MFRDMLMTIVIGNNINREPFPADVMVLTYLQVLTLL